MPDTGSVLVDSSALVAWFFERDQFHPAALARFEWIKQHQLLPVVTSYIVAETATVLSHRAGQPLARAFLEFTAELPVIFITEAFHQESLSLFEAQEQRGTSLVDCSNVVVMKRHLIDRIFSYDAVFTQTFQLTVVQ